MRVVTIVAVVLLCWAGIVYADTGFTAKLSDDLAMTKLVNEISFYRNTDSDFNQRGWTLQIVSINTFHVFTDFNFEFTSDFNWHLDLYKDHDYYMELSLVKPVIGPLSLNYQQIHGTFMGGTIHQFGVRMSL